jgi:hypothetical protein
LRKKYQPPDFPVSSVVDNLILLNLAGFGPNLRRFLTVVKSRGSKHEFDSREYFIGQGGIAFAPREENAPALLPASSYSSILSRAPTRLRTAQPAANGGKRKGHSA